MLALEFGRLLRSLEDHAGVRVEAGDLLEACREWEEVRLSYLRSAEGLTGAARVGLAQAVQENCSPMEFSGTRDAGSGVPVVLSGNLLNPRGMVSLLEKAGARVVWADLCNGDRPFTAEAQVEGEDIPRILDALAARYMDRHPCARMADGERRYRLLL